MRQTKLKVSPYSTFTSSQKLLFTVISERHVGDCSWFEVCAAVRLSFKSDLCSFDYHLVDLAHLRQVMTIR